MRKLFSEAQFARDLVHLDRIRCLRGLELLCTKEFYAMAPSARIATTVAEFQRMWLGEEPHSRNDGHGDKSRHRLAQKDAARCLKIAKKIRS